MNLKVGDFLVHKEGDATAQVVGHYCREGRYNLKVTPVQGQVTYIDYVEPCQVEAEGWSLLDMSMLSIQ